MSTKTKLTDEEALARLEEIDPATAVTRDRSAIAPIEAAVAARKASEEAVLVAVRDARTRGITWVEIASGLGVTYQAARQRYAHRV